MDMKAGEKRTVVIPSSLADTVPMGRNYQSPSHRTFRDGIS
jgi:hypothetical protein